MIVKINLNEKDFLKGLVLSLISGLMFILFCFLIKQRFIPANIISDFGIFLGIIISLIPGFIGIFIIKDLLYAGTAGAMLGIATFSIVCSRAITTDLSRLESLKLAAIMITTAFILLFFFSVIKLILIKDNRFFRG